MPDRPAQLSLAGTCTSLVLLQSLLAAQLQALAASGGAEGAEGDMEWDGRQREDGLEAWQVRQCAKWSVNSRTFVHSIYYVSLSLAGGVWGLRARVDQGE